MRRCVSCGKALSDNESFCKSCGNGSSFDSSEEYETNRSKYYGRQFEKSGKEYSNIIDMQPNPNINVPSLKGCTIGCMVIISLFVFLIAFAFGAFTPNKVFNGDGYKITYNKNWSKDVYGDIKVLKYKSEKSYLIPVSSTKLDVDCDFDKLTCKSEIYDYYFNEINSTLDSKLKLYKNNSFTNLKKDIYYTTYSYGLNKNTFVGKYYILISKNNKNVIIFMTSTSPENVDKFGKKVLKLFDSIEIDK